MKPVLSIIIVNFNGEKYINNCIESIKEKVKTRYEIIVVDNKSIDRSLELLKKYDKSITVIENTSNLGFASANNIGYANAVGEFVLLLNNDTVLLDGLSPAIEMMTNDKNIKLVGVKMLGSDMQYRFSCGYFPSARRLAKFSSLYRREGVFANGEFPSDSIAYDVDWIEGSFMLTTRENYSSLGGLDENYFMYVEDVDFCKRTVMDGGKIVYFPAIKYIHYGGFSHARTKYLYEGYFRYVGKFYKGSKKLAYISLLTTKINILKVKFKLEYLLTKDEKLSQKIQDLDKIKAR